MIPKLINQDRVLYLDSDIIVNGSLSDFYYSDLNGAPVGVVKDYGMGEHFPFPYLDASVSRNYLIAVFYLLIALSGEMKV